MAAQLRREIMWTQQTTKTGHVCSFQSDCGIDYVWSTQFDFDAGIDVAQFTVSPIDYYQSSVNVFFQDEDESWSCIRQQAERLVNPENSLNDWAEYAFHF